MKTALVLALAALMTTGAQASVTVYHDEASYAAALGASTIEDFSSKTLVPGLSVSGGVVADGVFNDGTSFGRSETTFSFADGTFGFGGVFDETPGGFGQGLAFSIDGTTLASTLDGANPGTFLGFVSSTVFTSVLIQSLRPDCCSETYTLDNLEFSKSAVPEPSSWALMIGGFGLIGAAMRRRTALLA